MMRVRARKTRIWSAVTCHRFHRLGDLSPKQGRFQQLGTTTGRPLAFNGDKSPARKLRELAALQSLRLRRQPRQVHQCSSVAGLRSLRFFVAIAAHHVWQPNALFSWPFVLLLSTVNDA